MSLKIRQEGWIFKIEVWFCWFLVPFRNTTDRSGPWSKERFKNQTGQSYQVQKDVKNSVRCSPIPQIPPSTLDFDLEYLIFLGTLPTVRLKDVTKNKKFKKLGNPEKRGKLRIEKVMSSNFAERMTHVREDGLEVTRSGWGLESDKL